MSTKKRNNLWEFFQGLGKTFMLPVALLAFMGLLLGIGSSFSSATTIKSFPFLGNAVLQFIFRLMSNIGGFAFSYLPVLFAISIPLGLARKEKGVAAFSGFVSYTIMHLSINFYLTEANQLAPKEQLRTVGQGMVFGFQTLEMGVLGGIIAGIIAYQLHRKYYNIQLHDSFAFFSGVRFVPIITSLVMSIVGLLVPVIWPVIANVIAGIGQIIKSSGIFAPFLFGSGERLLLPFGLHHILVAMIRFTDAGGIEIVNGESISGALNIFYAQLKEGVDISGAATAFLSQGKMPTFMFGLPGAALAMYHTARPENRKKIKGLLISGVIATAVTGITEPIEFLFLFASPFLWVFHVVMTGLGFMVMPLVGVVIGNTDGGLLDFLIFGIMQGSYTKWWLVPVVGAVWFVSYYFVFKWVIIRKNVQTPGRQSSDDVEYTSEELEYKGNKSYDVSSIVEALGGKNNIESLDNCVTRLRLVLSDAQIVDDDKLKQLGALGVVHLDEKNIQVIIGTKVSGVKAEMDNFLGI